jgi:folate-binding protein YgfZ
MVECLQGLLTNDVAQPGTGSVVYGALLTPKGMIVTDLWAAREAERFLLILPPAGRAPALEIFRRTLPPRLARVADLTGELQVAAVLGANAATALSAVGLEPGPADTPTVTAHDDVVITGHPPATPIRYHLLASAARLDALADDLLRSRAVEAAPEWLLAERICAGWPALGAEIDEKTLPQEARFDEIGGVSYTKGCYTGQETVARVHFRGHPNRELRGLAWDDGSELATPSIQHLGREVGTVRSHIRIGARRLGLAPIRREVPLGATVSAGGVDATVVPLPIPGEFLPR